MATTKRPAKVLKRAKSPAKRPKPGKHPKPKSPAKRPKPGKHPKPKSPAKRPKPGKHPKPKSPTKALFTFKDGTIVRCTDTKRVFIAVGGKLRPFKTEALLHAAGFVNGQYAPKLVKCSKLQHVPLGPPLNTMQDLRQIAKYTRKPKPVALHATVKPVGRAAGAQVTTPAPVPQAAQVAAAAGGDLPVCPTDPTYSNVPLPLTPAPTCKKAVTFKPLVPFGRFVSLTQVDSKGRETSVNVDNSQRNFTNIANSGGDKYREEQNDYLNAVLLALLARQRGQGSPEGPEVPPGLTMFNPPPNAAMYGPIDQSGFYTAPPTDEPSAFPSLDPQALAQLQYVPTQEPKTYTALKAIGAIVLLGGAVWLWRADRRRFAVAAAIAALVLLALPLSPSSGADAGGALAYASSSPLAGLGGVGGGDGGALTQLPPDASSGDRPADAADASGSS